MLKNPEVFSVIELQGDPLKLFSFKHTNATVAVKFILLNLSLIHQKYHLFHAGLKPIRSKKELVSNFIVLQLL